MIHFYNCPTCSGKSRLPRSLQVANDNDALNAIILPSLDVIRSPHFISRMALSYSNITLPRRALLDWVWDRYLEHRGLVLSHDRRTVQITDIDIDAVFETDSDPSQRWLHNFLTFAVKPPKQQAQCRTVERLACLYIGMAIAFPDVAEHLT